VPKGDKQVPKTYPAEMVAAVEALYAQGSTQHEIAMTLGVSQKVIWRLMHNHGISARPQIKRDQRGAANTSWKGDEAGYAALHKRVEVARGLPDHCAFDTMHTGRFEWANMIGHYEDIDDYVSLCVSCHRRYDAARRRDDGRNTSGLAPRRRR
jgi:hypothetical protein